MGQVLYYLLLKPISFLPLPLLYGLSNVLYTLLYYVIGYRRQLVKTNLQKSFPEWDERLLEKTAKASYRHLSDLIVESIRMFSIPEAEAKRRCVYHNPEIFDQFAAAGKSIVLVGGHYNNWEMLGITIERQIPHHAIGIYQPLSATFLDQKMRSSRGRFGMELASTRQIRHLLRQRKDELTTTIFAADQSPSGRNIHWMEFMGRDTAVAKGAEWLARTYDRPVIFGAIRKLRRGYYEVHFKLIEAEPTQSPPGAITEAHTRLLEQQIREAPENWLWTHRRWKRQR